jgi:hypothetical protein
MTPETSQDKASFEALEEVPERLDDEATASEYPTLNPDSSHHEALRGVVRPSDILGDDGVARLAEEEREATRNSASTTRRRLGAARKLSRARALRGCGRVY